MMLSEKSAHDGILIIPAPVMSEMLPSFSVC